MENSYEHKKRPNQGSPPTPNKAERAQPPETHPPTIHPPYLLTLESFYRWYAEQGCPTPNPDYSWTPNVSKAPRMPRPPSVPNLTQTPTTRIASIVQRHQIQHLPTPTWGHPLRRVSTQSKHAIKHQLVGHFHVEHEALRKVETQHPRHVNPRRRVGKKKPLDPRSRQTPTKTKRNEERRVESKIHKRPHQRRKRFKHNRRTYPGTDQRQVCKTHHKQPRTIESRTLAVPYISTDHLHTKHILNTPRLDEMRPHCEHKRREWQENDLIP
jgi:hypothetical protein